MSKVYITKIVNYVETYANKMAINARNQFILSVFVAVFLAAFFVYKSITPFIILVLGVIPVLLYSYWDRFASLNGFAISVNKVIQDIPDIETVKETVKEKTSEISLSDVKTVYDYLMQFISLKDYLITCQIIVNPFYYLFYIMLVLVNWIVAGVAIGCIYSVF